MIGCRAECGHSLTIVSPETAVTAVASDAMSIAAEAFDVMTIAPVAFDVMTIAPVAFDAMAIAAEAFDIMTIDAEAFEIMTIAAVASTIPAVELGGSHSYQHEESEHDEGFHFQVQFASVAYYVKDSWMTSEWKCCQLIYSVIQKQQLHF